MYAYVSTACLVGNIGGVMVSVLALSVADRRFETRSGQTKGYTIQWYVLLLC